MNLDFHKNYFEGEMLPLERFKLFTWVHKIKPEIVFEVGTGQGGGSTFFISHALKNLNSTIYTCDPHRGPSEEFLEEFKFVEYRKETSDKMLMDLISKDIKPNFIIFDGPENPDVALKDIIFLEKHIDDGTFFCMHDWDEYRKYDNARSTKAVKIREHIENSKNWTLLEYLSANKKNSDFDSLEFDSVGLCLYKFVK